MTRSVGQVLASILVFAFATVGMAANKPTTDLPTGFSVPGDFREDLSRRQYWDFDTVQFDSQHKFEGHHWHISVAAVQPNNDANVIVGLFATDLEKDGWTILRREGTLVAHTTGGGPERWVKANGNSGNFGLEVIEVAPPARSLTLKPPQATVETVSDTQDLPYMLPLPGSKMEKTIHDQRSIEIKLPNATQTSLAIADMTRWYDEPAGVSSYEFATVYRTALQAAGWDVTRVQVGGDVAVTAHYGKNGRDIWLYTHGDGGKQSINVVDYGAQTKQTALEQQLAKDGHVALYGIYFDTDSSVPRPESEATLENVLQTLKSDASLKLEIQGHTDDTGTPDHNATLSDARAASVLHWLVGHGIDATRLTSKGYGATMPVADNKSQEGKAKNRRVELAKLAAGVPGVAAVAPNPPQAPSAASGPLVKLPKGTVLTCVLAPAKGNDLPFQITNSTGQVLKKETIINTVVNWKSSAFPVGEKDDCFAIDADLAPNGAITRTNALDNGAVAQTCQAFVSAVHPSVVHAVAGGAASTFMECDPPTGH
jgi:OOP family OmpA-OmpF porin